MDWNTLPPFFDVKTLKEFLGIGTAAAYEMTRQEGFPAMRVGRSIRISRDGLKAWHDRKFGLAEEEPDSKLRLIK
ncbi:MAG: helix-turn-helix domain-containing protein [Fastidiosipilaceae bacterium]|jgi:excisionase family DNA binding protein